MAKYWIVFVAFLGAFLTDRGFPWWLSALASIGFEVVAILILKALVMMPMPTVSIGYKPLEGTIDG